MVAPSPLEFRRRNPTEQRVLELLRGGRAGPAVPVMQSGGHGRPIRPAGDEQRKQLRELAVRLTHQGFAVQPPRASYVHLDELRLLHLIAEAQAGKIDSGTTESAGSAIVEAAAILTAIGINLASAVN